MSEWREFWIADIIAKEFGEIQAAFKHHKNIKGSIHVIEYSAFSEALSRVKELEDALEFYADRSNWVSNSGKVGVTAIWTDDHDCEKGSEAGTEYRSFAGGRRARFALKGKEGE